MSLLSQYKSFLFTIHLPSPLFGMVYPLLFGRFELFLLSILKLGHIAYSLEVVRSGWRGRASCSWALRPRAVRGIPRTWPKVLQSWIELLVESCTVDSIIHPEEYIYIYISMTWRNYSAICTWKKTTFLRIQRAARAFVFFWAPISSKSNKIEHYIT